MESCRIKVVDENKEYFGSYQKKDINAKNELDAYKYKTQVGLFGSACVFNGTPRKPAVSCGLFIFSVHDSRRKPPNRRPTVRDGGRAV